MSQRNPPRSGILRALLFGVVAGLVSAWLLGPVLPPRPWKLDRRLLGEGNSSLQAPTDPGRDKLLSEAVDPRQGSPAAAAVRHNNAGVTLARKREWSSAAEELREALRLDPDNESIRRNLQQVLVAWGAEHFQAGELAGAMELLAEASRLRADPEVAYWLGQVWFQQGEPARARNIWEEALAQFPEHARLLLALGEFWEQQDDRVRALDYLVRARASGLGSPELQQKIERLSREIDAEWEYSTTRSARFDFRHPAFEDRAVLELVISSFEAAYDALLRRLGAGPNAPVRVVLYPSEDFYAVTRSPDWVGGAYTGRIQMPVGGLDETDRPHLERVARHELAHALVTEWSRGRAPAWLQEGLAMWCEDEQPGARRAWAETFKTRVPAFSVEALPQSFSTLDKGAAEVAYALSYLALVSLNEHYGVRRVLTFVSATGEQPWRDAFATTFGQSFEDFAAALR